MTEEPLDLLLAADEHFDPYAERILAAAREQIHTYGLRRTSLEAIAGAAGVGRATLFRRFPNRDALLFALAAREARAAIAIVDEQVADLDDPEVFLVTGVLAVIEQITSNSLLQRLLASDPEQMLPLLTTDGAPILLMGRAYIAGHLRRLRDGGAEITGDLDVVAEMLARMVLSLVLTRDSVLPLDDMDALARIARSTIVPLVLR